VAKAILHESALRVDYLICQTENEKFLPG